MESDSAVDVIVVGGGKSGAVFGKVAGASAAKFERAE
jgi:glycerol-3-phosphate dehydrogenase